MFKVKTKVTDKGPGIGRLVERLGGLGHLTLGVQGEEALRKHSTSELPVGAVAAVHELGLVPNAPKRSWLSSWIDANQVRMVAEAREVFQAILQGKMSRKRGFEKLGFQWAKEIRENLAGGMVKPALRPSTVRLKGRTVPLFDTGDVHNAISYKVFLPHWKNVPGGSAAGAARAAMAKTMPAPATEVKGLPQPPDKHGLGLADTVLAPGTRIKRAGPRFVRKYAGVGSTAYSAMRKRKSKAKTSGMKKVSGSLAKEVLRTARASRKSTWALKLLKKLAKQMMRGAGGADGRNHGYRGSKQYGRTGRSGRR